MKKLQKKRFGRKKEKEWARFTEGGLHESVDEGENHPNIQSNHKQPINEVNGEAGGNQVTTIMQPEDICDLRKKLGVVNA